MIHLRAGILFIISIASASAAENQAAENTEWQSEGGSHVVSVEVRTAGLRSLSAFCSTKGQPVLSWSIPLGRDENIQFAVVASDGAAAYCNELGELTGISRSGHLTWKCSQIEELAFPWIKAGGTPYGAWLSRSRVVQSESSSIVRIQLPTRGPLCWDLATGKPVTLPANTEADFLRVDLDWAKDYIASLVKEDGALRNIELTATRKARLFLAVCIACRYASSDWEAILPRLKALKVSDDIDSPYCALLGRERSCYRRVNVLKWAVYTALMRMGECPRLYRDRSLRVRMIGGGGSLRQDMPWRERPDSCASLVRLVAQESYLKSVLVKLGAYDWYASNGRFVYDCNDGSSAILHFAENGTFAREESLAVGYWDTDRAMEDLLTAFRVFCRR